MKKLLYIVIAILINSTWINAQDIIQNIESRSKISLNGNWGYIMDPYETGYYNYRRIPYEETEWPAAGFYTNQKQKDKTERIEYEFDTYNTLLVPGDWNSQYPELRYYEGTIWYQKDFTLNKKEGKRYFIYFGAINYQSIIYINGQRVGDHTGGFTSFNFEVTDFVTNGDNFVVVKVDNARKKEAIPTINTDWWNYGGITRDVNIVEVNSTFISDYKLNLTDYTKKEIEFSVQLNGEDKSGQNIVLSIPELGIKQEFVSDNDGQYTGRISSKKMELWSPESPKLYTVNLSCNNATLKDKIGFRTIETQGTDILLNGQKMFLRGICIHEENPLKEARATGEGDARTLLGWAKDLECNYVRLAHYPHNEAMVKLADEMGLMVWSEIPVYWTIDWKNKSTYQNAEHQLTEMIDRDKNRSSIIIWSIGNETPIKPERIEFMSNLAKKAKSLDNTRLISAALELHYYPAEEKPNTAILEDPLAEYLDIMSFNEYIGWYGNKLEDIPDYTIEFKYKKPVLISELGAGALGGFHGDADTRWSEEFQAEFYRQQLKMISKHEQIKGLTPWILADFKSPKRLHPVYQGNWNRKGLISNTGTKKIAFEVLKEFYLEKK